jgi:hypothetical protein
MSGRRVGSFLPCKPSPCTHPRPSSILKLLASVIADALCRSCHGEAIYPGVIDPKTGESVINGKTITGFTTQAEYEMNIMDEIRSWGEPLIDEWAEKLGAKCRFALASFHWLRLTHFRRPSRWCLG